MSDVFKEIEHSKHLCKIGGAESDKNKIITVITRTYVAPLYSSVVLWNDAENFAFPVRDNGPIAPFITNAPDYSKLFHGAFQRRSAIQRATTPNILTKLSKKNAMKRLLLEKLKANEKRIGSDTPVVNNEDSMQNQNEPQEETKSPGKSARSAALV